MTGDGNDRSTNGLSSYSTTHVDDIFNVLPGYLFGTRRATQARLERSHLPAPHFENPRNATALRAAGTETVQLTSRCNAQSPLGQPSLTPHPKVADQGNLRQHAGCLIETLSAPGVLCPDFSDIYGFQLQNEG